MNAKLQASIEGVRGLLAKNGNQVLQVNFEKQNLTANKVKTTRRDIARQLGCSVTVMEAVLPHHVQYWLSKQKVPARAFHAARRRVMRDVFSRWIEPPTPESE